MAHHGFDKLKFTGQYFRTSMKPLTRLTRVNARCLRLKLLLKPVAERSQLMDQCLSPERIHQAFLTCIFSTQSYLFKDELENLHQEKLLKRHSLLTRLHSFIDSTRILNVGGRLANSPVLYYQRHPVIFHGESPLAKLTVDWAHRIALHGGFQLTYSYAVRRAWIIRGRVLVKAHIRDCFVRTRIRLQKSAQLMGNLPSERVTVSFPFEKTGVDYARPLAIKWTV
ncbi:uncharacterized protein LOC117171059 [Belonocnema kinseyi]|uniref:uncharacterized protein LOC117171059 n=1 Tax=Belonocnema kinseyi TaxID=2817044 RepID=UPI00143DB98F|nr:uncharacterized protein LOC117171059 [Belonocnema kinseyi]